MPAALTIARYTLLEARRNRLGWLVLAIVLAGLGLALFLDQLALTEVQAQRVTMMAAFYRLAGAFLVATFVIGSIVRDFNDKGVEWLLSLPLRRADWLIGKLLGYVAGCSLLALALALPLALMVPLPALLAWTASLAMELTVVAAAALFFVVSLPQFAGAMAATAAYYVLARSLAALLLIGQGPLTDATSLGQQVINGVLFVLALLLPRLDGFADSGWLIHAAPDVGQLLQMAGQGLLGVGVLLSAALIDLYRREF